MALSAHKIAKIAPSAVALALVGYCVWPSAVELISAPEPPKSPKKVPQLAESLLSPKLVPALTKNPWGGKDVLSLAAAGKAAAAKANSMAVGVGARKKNGSKPRDPLLDIKLNATYILGDRRMAVINGRLHGTEDIVVPASPAGPAYKLVGVLPHKVLLQCGGKVMELAYSNVAAHADTSPRAGVGGNSTRAPRPADPIRPEVATMSKE